MSVVAYARGGIQEVTKESSCYNITLIPTIFLDSLADVQDADF